jgi:DNA-binding NtrC family response regulator
LIVDDEATIREAMRVILEKHRYRVVTAADGEAGIALFIQHQASVRLVITDLMMPGIGGQALVRALKGLIPALRVIICSGMDQHDKQAELEQMGVTEVLAKPYTATALLTAVGHALR